MCIDCLYLLQNILSLYVTPLTQAMGIGWPAGYIQQQIGFALSLTWSQATGSLESLPGH